MVSGNSKRETRLHWEDLLHLRIRSAGLGRGRRPCKRNWSLRREQGVYYSTLNKKQYEQNIMEITGKACCLSFYPAVWVWLVLSQKCWIAFVYLYTDYEVYAHAYWVHEYGLNCWGFILPDKSVCFVVYAFCLTCWPTAIVCIAMLVLSPDKSL